MRLSNTRYARATRLALTVAMALAWCAGPQGASLVLGSTRAMLLTIPSRDQWGGADRLALEPATQPSAVPTADEVAARVEQTLRSIDPGEYDYAVRARALGPGVEPVFNFVRDHVRFESYSGALRGPEITFTSCAGNAVDRAMLLAAMLREHEIPVRYARGRLDAATAEKLLERTFEPPAPRGNPPRAGPSLSESNATLERLRRRAARDYGTMRAALGEQLPPCQSVSREQLLREITSHLWVQARIDGAWTDLDPSLADAKPGTRLCDAAETFDAIPSELEQQVTVRVVIETLEGGVLKQASRLEFTSAARHLLGRQVFLAHSKGDPGVGPAGGIGGALGAAQGGEVWTPALFVDGNWSVGAPISYIDATETPADAPAARGGPPAGGGLSGAFGQGGALASEPAQTVAEWVEILITFPDGTKDLTRRVLVDRAGAAWRAEPKPDAAKLSPLPRDAQGFTTPREIHNLWFTAGRHDLLAYAEALHLLADVNRTLGDSSPPEGLSFEEQAWPMAVQSFSLLVMSEHVIVPSLNDDPRVRLYADSPRVIFVTAGPLPHAEQPESFLQIDLRRDKLRGVARDGAPPGALAERKLWFAALEGALEHEVSLQIALATGWGERDVGSTSALLGAGAGGAGEVVVHRAGATPAPGELPVHADSAALVRGALASGASVVIPRAVLRDPEPGWWEIANTGDARAVYGPNLNAGRVPRIRGGPNLFYEKPPVRKPLGDPKPYRVYEPKKPSGPPVSQRPSSDPNWFKGAQDRARDLAGKVRGGPPRTNPLAPAKKEQGAAATEYPAVVQFARNVVGVAGFVLLHVGLIYGQQILTMFVNRLLSAGLGADLSGP
jgi:hypothetical protein